ncbi:hypothetical protein BGW41_005642 [Actinomortierella wolfii]|nr:hypothetical protein BGW41_005642 [Actinomortierella wolfii]
MSRVKKPKPDKKDDLDDDPREDAVDKKKYRAARHPLILCHGFSGFDTLGTNPDFCLDYWYGVRDVLEDIGCTVHAARVPPFASIEHRAQRLHEYILRTVPHGSTVHLIGHSMGGLDCRYLISRLLPRLRAEMQLSSLRPSPAGNDRDHNTTATMNKKGEEMKEDSSQPHYTVKSLTTLGTPHRGSSFADYVMSDLVGQSRLEWFWTALEAVGIDRGAALNLTTQYLRDEFNPRTPNDPNVLYFSYGASFQPGLFSRFRFSWRVIMDREGPNDGLVSVESAKWGTYIRTIENADHLDLMNWVNALAWSRARFPWILGGSSHDAQGRPKGAVEMGKVDEGESEGVAQNKSKGAEEPPLFNALQLYLEISENLYKHGL